VSSVDKPLYVAEFWKFRDCSCGRVENELQTIQLILGKVEKKQVALIEF